MFLLCIVLQETEEWKMSVLALGFCSITPTHVPGIESSSLLTWLAAGGGSCSWGVTAAWWLDWTRLRAQMESSRQQSLPVPTAAQGWPPVPLPPGCSAWPGQQPATSLAFSASPWCWGCFPESAQLQPKTVGAELCMQ